MKFPPLTSLSSLLFPSLQDKQRKKLRILSMFKHIYTLFYSALLFLVLVLDLKETERRFCKLLQTFVLHYLVVVFDELRVTVITNSLFNFLFYSFKIWNVLKRTCFGFKSVDLLKKIVCAFTTASSTFDQKVMKTRICCKSSVLLCV